MKYFQFGNSNIKSPVVTHETFVQQYFFLLKIISEISQTRTVRTQGLRNRNEFDEFDSKHLGLYQDV